MERYCKTAFKLFSLIVLSSTLSACLTPEVLQPEVANTVAPTTTAATLPVSLFAGNLKANGFQNGAALTDARFNNPKGMVKIGTDYYLADYGNKLIRKMNSSGVVSTFAGTTQSASPLDGTGTSARFIGPSGITAIGTDLYVSEGSVSIVQRYNIIRKITAAGEVTTIAGTYNVAGAANGAGAAATFKGPVAITNDGTDLYVAEINNCIRKVTTAGVVTTFVGTCGTAGNVDTAGGAPKFGILRGIVFDSTGNNFYATDYTNGSVRKITPAGVVTTVASGIPTPNGITTDGTNLYVSTNNSGIFKVTFAGVVTAIAGIAGVNGNTDGNGTSGLFWSPFSIFYDGLNFIISDTGNGMIRAMNSTFDVTRVAGIRGSMVGTTDGTTTDATFSLASNTTAHLVSNGTDLYALDANNFTIRKVTSSGVVTTFAGTAGVSGNADGIGTAASFGYLTGGAFKGSDLFVTTFDGTVCSLRKITPNGTVTTVVTGDCTTATGILPGASGVANIGTDLYVANSGNSLLYKIDSSYNVTTVAGIQNVLGGVDGPYGTNTLTTPLGLLAIGTDLYITEPNRVRKMDNLGNVTTLAGSGVAGSADGIGIAATFNGLRDLTTDGAGNIYVTDLNNSLIRKIEIATGTVSTFAGNIAYNNTGVATSAAAQDVDGTLAGSWFNSPMGIVFTGFGMFVMEPYNIRKIILP